MVALVNFSLGVLGPFGLELCALLLKLSFLFRRQHSQHLLPHLELLSHQFCLQAGSFLKLLSGQSFTKRSALAGLTQLLALGPDLLMQRFCALAEALIDRLHACLLVVCQGNTCQHHAMHTAATALMPSATAAFAFATAASVSPALTLSTAPRRA